MRRFCVIGTTVHTQESASAEPHQRSQLVARVFPFCQERVGFMTVIRGCFVTMLCLVVWLAAAPGWGQSIAVFPKEEILLVGGDFRLRSIFSNIAGADTAGGGESGGFPTDDGGTKSFFDTRLRLYWDFRPSELLRVHYRMEIGDIRFGGSNTENGTDVSGDLLPVISTGSGEGV